MLLHIPANFFADLHVLSHRAGQKGIERLHVLSHACGEGHRAWASPCGYQHTPRGTVSAAGETLHLRKFSSQAAAAAPLHSCAPPAQQPRGALPWGEPSPHMPGPWHTVSRRCTAFSSRSTSLSMPALSTTCRHTTCSHLPAAGEPRARCLSAASYQPCQPQKGSHPALSPGDAAGRWQGCLAVSSHARGRLVLLQALLKGHILPVPLLVTLIRLREL